MVGHNIKCQDLYQPSPPSVSVHSSLVFFILIQSVRELSPTTLFPPFPNLGRTGIVKFINGKDASVVIILILKNYRTPDTADNDMIYLPRC